MPQNVVYKSLQQRPQICMQDIAVVVVVLCVAPFLVGVSLSLFELVDFNIYLAQLAQVSAETA